MLNINRVYSILLYRRDGDGFYLTRKLITRLYRRWPSFESHSEISPGSLRTSRAVIASIADAVAPQEINPLVAMEAKEVELDDNGESLRQRSRVIITKESSRLHSTSRGIEGVPKY